MVKKIKDWEFIAACAISVTSLIGIIGVGFGVNVDAEVAEPEPAMTDLPTPTETTETTTAEPTEPIETTETTETTTTRSLSDVYDIVDADVVDPAMVIGYTNDGHAIIRVGVTTTMTTVVTTETETETYDIEEEYEDTEDYPISESEYIVICNCVGHEAGADNIPVTEKAKVVEVIMNRVYDDRWPDNVYDVITEPYQFEGSSEYAYLDEYSWEVSDMVREAVDLYFEDPDQFDHGYTGFYGDGYQNYFS